MHAALQGLDSFLAMSSMFGYTGTLVLILSLGSLSYYTACLPLFIFIAGACWECMGGMDVGPAQQQQQLHQVAQGLPLSFSNSRQQAAGSRFAWFEDALCSDASRLCPPAPAVLTCVCPAALTLSVFAPAKPLLWLGFQHSTLVSSWRRYFQFSFVMEEKLDQEGRYIFAGGGVGV